MKKYLFVVVWLIVSIPHRTFAHVKWFTEEEAHRLHMQSIITPLFIGLTLFSVITLITLIWIAQHMEDSRFVQQLRKFTLKEKAIYTVLQYSVAIALFMQLVNGNLFAPELHIHNPIYTWILVFIILLFIIPTTITAKIASITLLILYAQFAIEYSWFHMLDYFFYFGIIGYFLCKNTKFDEWKYPILFFSVGLSLCWLATEKWIYPGMTVNIIENYHVPLFGFSPNVFTIISAFVEFAIGISFMLRILNRFFAIIFTGVMILTSFMFGYEEIIGHFLMHIIMIVFIIQQDKIPNFLERFFHNRIKQFAFLAINYIVLLVSFLTVYYFFA